MFVYSSFLHTFILANFWKRQEDTNLGLVGRVRKNLSNEKGGYEITIDNRSDGGKVVDIVPMGLELLVSEGELIKVSHLLMNNPNVGAFG